MRPFLLISLCSLLACDSGDSSDVSQTSTPSGGHAGKAGSAQAGAGQAGSAQAGAGQGGAGLSGSSGQGGAAGAGAAGAAGQGGKGGQAGVSGQGGAGSGGAGSGGAGAGGAGGFPVCVAPGPTPVGCVDLTDLPGSWTTYAEDSAESSVTVEASGSWGEALAGKAARVDTKSGFAFHARLDLEAPTSAGEGDAVQLAVRARNDNPTGWQINAPVLVLEDAAGKRLTLTPSSQHLPTDGVTWALIEAPLAGGPGWTASGDSIDTSKIRAVEIGADTWEYGFWFVVDALSFRKAGQVCDLPCSGGCGPGTCLPAELRCACPLGWAGERCEACGEGFVAKNGACVLAADGDFDEWPNPVSRANSDPWLAVHEGKIRKVKPRLLVVHFPNHKEGVLTSDLEGSRALVESVTAGFREGSRPRGYADAGAEPQLDYEIVKVVDARDGAQGRPPAPAGWPYDNSTLYPRLGEAPSWKLDYAAFFGDAFAQLYDIEDPQAPGKKLALCELIDRGLVHELWIVASGDVASDASAYEVLEAKQRYTAEGNKIAGSLDRCAGNGCFEASTPVCKRSVRIGFVNYTRGPGCYLHSQGHGIESFGRRGVVPRLRDWLVPFAGFDLDTRYGLPVPDFYAVGCAQEPCISMPTPSSLRVDHHGAISQVSPYDARCGSVHFPPNGQSNYDYTNTTPVLTSCQGFGRNGLGCGKDAASTVNADTWAGYEPLAPDCGGAFLVWWYQNMPAHGSGQSFPDGSPMPPIWPALFY